MLAEVAAGIVQRAALQVGLVATTRYDGVLRQKSQVSQPAVATYTNHGDATTAATHRFAAEGAPKTVVAHKKGHGDHVTAISYLARQPRHKLSLRPGHGHTATTSHTSEHQREQLAMMQDATRHRHAARTQTSPCAACKTGKTPVK